MKNIVKIFITPIVLVASCAIPGPAEYLVQPLQAEEEWGQWVSFREDFSRFQPEKSRITLWQCKDVEIAKGEYIASVGQASYSPARESEEGFYCISVLNDDGMGVMGELKIPLSFVSEKSLSAEAEEIASYDSKRRIVSFDLGLSVFEFQLNKVDG